MSILVKDIEMPICCEECILDHKFFKWLGCNKHVTGDIIVNGERSPSCPLIYVPEPHGNLIDADALTISTAVPLDSKPYQYVHIDNIKAAPIIIPASEKGET